MLYLNASDTACAISHLEHWNVSLPIIVDNAESVVNLKDVDAQIIRLVVSEKHKTLMAETDKAESVKMA